MRGWVLLLALLVPCAARAAFCTVDPPVPGPRHDFEFLAGYSPASSTLIGTTTGRRFVLAGFSYSYRCWQKQHMSIEYTGAVMPAAIVLQPARIGNPFYNAGSQPAHAVYGFAIAPVGFTFELRPGRRMRPYAEALGGVIASTEPIPINGPDATGLNFLFDFGGGLRWQSEAGHRAVSVGYKFLHISNAFTTDNNPGLDNNVVYVAYSFLR